MQLVSAHSQRISKLSAGRRPPATTCSFTCRNRISFSATRCACSSTPVLLACGATRADTIRHCASYRGLFRPCLPAAGNRRPAPRENEKGPRWRAFLAVGDVTVGLADAGGVTVVRAELSPILLVTDKRVLELGCVLDLVLCPFDEDLLVIVGDALNDARRKHDLLPEDPRAGIDDEIRRANLVGRVVNLPNRPVVGLDPVSDHTAGRDARLHEPFAIRPHARCHLLHQLLLFVL